VKKNKDEVSSLVRRRTREPCAYVKSEVRVGASNQIAGNLPRSSGRSKDGPGFKLQISQKTSETADTSMLASTKQTGRRLSKQRAGPQWED